MEELIFYSSLGGSGVAGLAVVLWKAGVISLNGNGKNGVMLEKLSHLESSQDKIADAMMKQTVILEVQKDNGSKMVDLQEKLIEKLIK